MRERTYYSQLCLIQIAGNSEAITVDALANEINLNPILDLMENQQITKVFHACRLLLRKEWLYRDIFVGPSR